VETSETDDILGTDLLLSEEEYGSDLTLTERERRRPEERKEFGDLEVVSGPFNLGQAIVDRLRTRKGELEELGHPDYGSRLFEVIGQPNNERTRVLVRSFIQEALRQEPRVREILNIIVTTPKENMSQVNVEIIILPMGSKTPLTAEFVLQLEVA
jgi:phage baseplate assembly protein W